MKTIQPDIELRPGQTARLCGVEYRTLWNWGNAGEGPKFTVVGHERRYRFSDVIAWLRDRQTGGEQ